MPRDRDIADVTWALCCAVIEEHAGAVAPIVALVEVATTMASRLNVLQRFQVSEAIRDCADLVEHAQQPVRVEGR